MTANPAPVSLEEGGRHTPGPWTVSEGHKNRIIWGGDDVVAEVHWWVIEGAAESKANALLIAAAPDLLAVAKAFLASYPGGINDGLDAVRSQARAAISRAEGRS